MHMTKHVFKLIVTRLAVAILLLSLAACGGRKKVITVDDSADYKNEVSLQPLKRPDSKTVVLNPSPPVTQPEVVNQPQVQEIENVSDQPDSQEDDSSVVDSTDTELATVVSESVDTDSQITSTILDSKNGAVRMEINAELDQAWNYLNNNLKTSDLTVFSRNKVAQRFSIGCGGIEAAEAAVKKSGWSFLNREKHERLEYCALEITEKRGKSQVAVLNRSGVEVLAAFSKPIFERILAK